MVNNMAAAGERISGQQQNFSYDSKLAQHPGYDSSPNSSPAGKDKGNIEDLVEPPNPKRRLPKRAAVKLELRRC